MAAGGVGTGGGIGRGKGFGSGGGRGCVPFQWICFRRNGNKSWMGSCILI